MRLAIIDIGYNAIRAVVYENHTLGAPEIFNDKFKSDLLSLLSLDDLNVKHQSYLSLQYLTHIFKRLGVTQIKCVATAVLRGHPKAEQFGSIIKEKFNIDIDVISGDKEAYLTAAGLISGISEASGLAADLGGGSLELAEISNKKVGTRKSLPLGTKVITEKNIANQQTITEMIRQEFGESTYKNIYLIGGAFRFIGRYYMDFAHYPIKNLHNLEISRDDFELYLEKLDRIQKNHSSGYEYKKVDYNAILVAKALLDVFSAEKVTISNYGLKEGVRFSSLSEEQQKKDIVFERINSLVRPNINYNLDSYIGAVRNLLITPDALTIDLINLVIMLTQFNRSVDKTLKANFAVEIVLSSDIPFTHRQRIALALALYFAYHSKSDMYINKLAKRMLSKLDYSNCQIIGNFIRLARDVDGPEFQEPSFSLELKDKYIEIVTKDILPRPVFDKVCERLKDIALARKTALYP